MSNVEVGFVEPRKIFLGFLITKLMEAEACLYISGPRTATIQMLKGIIDSLDKDSKVTLKLQYEQLEQAENNGVPKKKLEGIFRQITDYLHETYLREMRGPPTKKRGLEDLEKKLSEN